VNFQSANKILDSRRQIIRGLAISHKVEAEGGCGVVGAACSNQIRGKHLLSALKQMKNRGNGKGGGIAAAGLMPEQLGISPEILRNDYLIQIAYLDSDAQHDVEREFIQPCMKVDHAAWVETISDYQQIKDLEVKPPSVRRYFCRVDGDVLAKFMQKTGIRDAVIAEDEFVYQNSYALNRKYYASLGEKKAFVLSHGKDMIVLKIVGYADQVIRYYKLEEFRAHVWIGHHRYPTKGKVWHPGGAHPFVGLHEALVHNGDFSNYHSVSEYLAQRNIFPLFLTDTEVAAYLFDLLSRIYRYPIEFVLEAMAPTTERDFQLLPEDKKSIYREIQAAHIHGSPDGPWFFIVAGSENNGRTLRLLGITDTSMLRPQVFALQENKKARIGLIASERQAIDACLRSLANEDEDYAAKADRYWNARGGSYTDGGAFIFTVDRGNEKTKLICTDKFGKEIELPPKNSERILSSVIQLASSDIDGIRTCKNIEHLCEYLKRDSQTLDESISSAQAFIKILDNLHRLPNYQDGKVRDLLESSLFELLRRFPPISDKNASPWKILDLTSKGDLRSPLPQEDALLLDVGDFPAEGVGSASALIVAAYQKGWKHVISFDWRGQRFCGVGLGPKSNGFKIDVFGNPGDYLASGIDGAEIIVHASAQDQVGQIMKSGKLVIYGDVGQTFMYGAKGGNAYVLGNAAGRPLINAAGRPRVVINGTCLDYLAESFMTGDPLNGGGFVVLNGIIFENGEIIDLQTPYPGGNLFSLATGGAIYVRDPHRKLDQSQLNGGRLGDTEQTDWNLIHPYLEENERLFGARIEDLLRRQQGSSPWKIYEKVDAARLNALEAR